MTKHEAAEQASHRIRMTLDQEQQGDDRDLFIEDMRQHLQVLQSEYDGNAGDGEGAEAFRVAMANIVCLVNALDGRKP